MFKLLYVELSLRCQELINSMAAVFFNSYLIKLPAMEKISWSYLFTSSKTQGQSVGSIKCSWCIVNFHHEHFIEPTNCPWVSEDDSFSDCSINLRCLVNDFSSKLYSWNYSFISKSKHTIHFRLFPWHCSNTLTMYRTALLVYFNNPLSTE